MIERSTDASDGAGERNGGTTRPRFGIVEWFHMGEHERVEQTLVDLAQPGVELVREGRRYEPTQESCRLNGISETQGLDFHSPYGCSKGVADQTVRDYARSYGLPTVTFRMSCIYGPHQCGTEDQGWVAHFLIRALQGLPITLYGDGHQVRDILYVEDLVDAMLGAMDDIERASGHAFNMGGGPAQVVSLLELIEIIEQIMGRSVDVRFEDWRVGDQRYYASDVRRFTELTGWSPGVGVHEGVERLHDWLGEHRADLIEAERGGAAAGMVAE